jgi:hypothetical protein
MLLPPHWKSGRSSRRNVPSSPPIPPMPQSPDSPDQQIARSPRRWPISWKDTKTINSLHIVTSSKLFKNVINNHLHHSIANSPIYIPYLRVRLYRRHQNLDCLDSVVGILLRLRSSLDISVFTFWLLIFRRYPVTGITDHGSRHPLSVRWRSAMWMFAVCMVVAAVKLVQGHCSQEIESGIFLRQ